MKTNTQTLPTLTVQDGIIVSHALLSEEVSDIDKQHLEKRIKILNKHFGLVRRRVIEFVRNNKDKLVYVLALFDESQDQGKEHLENFVDIHPRFKLDNFCLGIGVRKAIHMYLKNADPEIHDAIRDWEGLILIMYYEESFDAFSVDISSFLSDLGVTHV